MRRDLQQIAMRRARLEHWIEVAIAALDALDGDPDFEPGCEDEGAQCDDEGAIEYEQVPVYADNGHDQTRFASGIAARGF